MLIISLEYTPVTLIILCIICFNACSNHTTFKLQSQRTRIQITQFVAFISDTPVTFKQSQSHLTYNDNVDPKQGYNHAKFERSCFNGVPRKEKKHSLRCVVLFVCFVFQMRKYVHYLPWICVLIKKKWYIHGLPDMLNNPIKFQLNCMRTWEFQLKLFDTPVTLKYEQGHWK